MSQSPKIVRLDLLDTEYAQIIEGEPIAKSREARIDTTDSHAIQYVRRQIARYRHGNLDQEGKDDALFNIGAMVGLMTPSDVEDVNDRLRYEGRLYLTESERQQIFNWLADELAVHLGEGG
ncbi:MAG: hypothetical protein AAF766_06760 [Cyanobacteria bacterium P01_D01_bin.14]